MNCAKSIRNEITARSPQRKVPDGAREQPPDSWTYPSPKCFVRPQTRQSQSFYRKRRIYADYRELLALESQAKKLNFLGPEGARSSLPERQPQLHERALDFPDHPAGKIEAGMTAYQPGLFKPEVFEPIERRAVLVVDQRMNMFFGSRKNLKSVVAANVAALIAWRILVEKKQISGVIFNDRKIVQFAPGCSRLHTLLILQAVLNLNHTLLPNKGVYSNARMLNDALRRIDKLAGDHSSIFLITDASGCDQETSRLTTNISQQNDLVVTLIYDPQQADFCNPSHFLDDHCLSKVDVRKRARLLREKNQSASERQRILNGRLFPDGIPVIPLNTRDDVAYQLRRAFTKTGFLSLTKTQPSPRGDVFSPQA